MEFTRYIKDEDFDKIEVFLKNGHNASMKLSLHGNWTPLELITDNRNIEIAQLLLNYGADVNGMSDRAPLHCAASNNDIPMMKLLLSNNADPNIQSDAKNTPLHSASLNSSLEAVKLLLTISNIDCLVLNEESKSAFDRASNQLVKKMIKIKMNEQENKKLVSEVHAIEVADIQKNIDEKEKEVADLSIKCVKLSAKIASLIDELELVKIKYPIALNDLNTLKTQMDQLTSNVKPSYSIVEDENLECPCCFLVPMAPVVIYQCDNGHVLCSKCAENINKCPQCRISLGRMKRNRQMEKIIAAKKCLTDKDK